MASQVTCKLCACIIPPEHLADGRAFQAPGVSLCATCSGSGNIAMLPGRPGASSTRALKRPSLNSPAPSRAASSAQGLEASTSRVTLRRVAAPGGERSSTAPAVLTSAGKPRPSLSELSVQLRSAAGHACKRCGTKLSPGALARGEAILHNDKLLCARCYAGISVWRKRLCVGGTLTVLIAAILMLLVPEPVLFVLALLGLATVIGGALHQQLRGVWRATLCLGGLLLALFCLWQIFALRASRDERVVRDALQEAQHHIEKLLQNEQPLDAVHEIQRLRSNTHAASPQSLAACELLVERWLERSYPGSNPGGRRVLMELINAFPQSDGFKRFGAIKVEDRRFSLSVNSADDSPRTWREPEMERTISYEAGFQDAWLVLSFLFGNYTPEQISLTLAFTSGKQYLITLDRTVYQNLKEVKDPAAMLSTLAAQH